MRIIKSITQLLSLVSLLACCSCASINMNDKELLESHKKAAVDGNGDSAATLASYYIIRIYKPELARYWAGIGVSRGNTSCMYSLGFLMVSGLGGPTDTSLGMGLIELSAKLGNQAAIDYLKAEKMFPMSENGR
jgi:TPR repeat protein